MTENSDAYSTYQLVWKNPKIIKKSCEAVLWDCFGVRERKAMTPMHNFCEFHGMDTG